jgi:cytochrome P450
MNGETLMLEITKPESRADPYPLYAEARRLGVSRQHDGAYLVATQRDVAALLHDPRVSSDPRNRADPVPLPPVFAFITQDAPNHDRLRRIAMNQFGPPDHAGLVASREPNIAARFDALLADLVGRTRIDIVDDLAYPLPVAVICEMLGVPPEDEGTFHTMADDLVRAAGAQDQANAEELLELQAATRAQLGAYLFELIGRHRANPADNLLSRLANDTSTDPMEDLDLVATGALMLVAGHETTVNLIANGTLTMLRHPHLRERLRAEPEIALRFVEELLRFEPPVQYLPNRVARTDIEVAGTTIPKGSRIILLLAAASRDPDLFVNPDEFDPDRPDNQHFGFGGGIHYCFGAPLARLEGQLALTAIARRLDNPRLVVDPPPYRPSPVLRGPIHLEVDVDAVLT